MRRYQIALVAAVAKVPREVVLELRHSELTRAFDFLVRPARAFPEGWRDLIADLTRFWGWGPHDAWGLTGTQLIWWAEQSRRIAERERERPRVVTMAGYSRHLYRR